MTLLPSNPFAQRTCASLCPGLAFCLEQTGVSAVWREPGETTRRCRLGHEVFDGPTGHAIDWTERTLLLAPPLSEARCHLADWGAEWLHELAHVVVSPPWEANPDECHEYGGVFAWELTVAYDLVRRGLWTHTHTSSVVDVQALYGISSSARRLAPGYTEWGSLPDAVRASSMRYMRRTLQLAGMLGPKNDVLWGQAPTWTDEVKGRWGHVG